MLFEGESTGTLNETKLANGDAPRGSSLFPGPRSSATVDLLPHPRRWPRPDRRPGPQGQEDRGLRPVRRLRRRLRRRLFLLELQRRRTSSATSSSSTSSCPSSSPERSSGSSPTASGFAATAAFILLLFGVEPGADQREHYRRSWSTTRTSRPGWPWPIRPARHTGKGTTGTPTLLTAVSREKVIVASTTVERYPYYQLIYDTEASGRQPHLPPRHAQADGEGPSNSRSSSGAWASRSNPKAIGDWLLV